MAPLERREDMINVLAALGIDIPRDSKMSGKRLKQRIAKALNRAQLLSKRLPSPPLNLHELPPWTGPPLEDAFSTTNMAELAKGMQVLATGTPVPGHPNEENVFNGLRATILAIASLKDKGLNALVIQDKDQQAAMCIRVSEVYQLDRRAPVIILLYQWYFRGNDNEEMFGFVSQNMRGEDLSTTEATVEEQRLLMRLLSQNSLLVPSSNRVVRQSYENGFRVSCVMPIGPLSMKDLGALNAEMGCEVCGDKGRLRCPRCESVIYCSEACSIKNQLSHKSQCDDLSQGNWKTITVQTRDEAAPGTTNYNRYTRIDAFGSDLDMETTEGPSPNIHGNNPFVVKIQMRDDDVYIYDRQASIDFFVMRSKDREHYMMLCAAARTGLISGKCYRWVKRVSDLELSVCLDKQPPQDLKW
ncbi:hypothetical protein SISNIDRAFT_484370 [Sistotremastrum niveocremeum HHB9708]|uniref:MYND-type domain-containing protein n=1 Tax=Sistotremastrum niveocremeum HHB9708 TaxID=1314777 RepID=A0A164W8T1_9AGAM|nr:hypothetical protein SISNIDRAFT_484370 [Sistotremastrum niveocremeum HHB9708]